MPVVVGSGGQSGGAVGSGGLPATGGDYGLLKPTALFEPTVGNGRNLDIFQSNPNQSFSIDLTEKMRTQ